MNQHLHLITLGVRDLAASRQFYAETLGWRAHPQKAAEGLLGRVQFLLCQARRFCLGGGVQPVLRVR